MTTSALRYQSNTMEAYDVKSNNTLLGGIRLFLNLGDYRPSGVIVVDDTLYDWNKGWFGKLTIDPSCPNRQKFERAISKFV